MPDETMPNETIAALILAGGKSRRMGQDKALIEFDGVPLLRRVYDVAHQCCSQVYVIAPWLDRYQTILPLDRHFLQEIIIPEDLEPHGPLIGFAQGLTHIQLQFSADWVLLLACDLPHLQGAILQTWMHSLPSLDRSVMAFLPKHPKGWEPLCGFYRPQCLPALNAYIAQGGRSFQGWLSSQIVQVAPLKHPQMLLNCNTPQQLIIDNL